MKKIKYFLLVATLIFVTAPTVMAGTQANMNSQTSWTNGYSLVLLDCNSLKEAKSARDYIESQGGRIALILSEHAMTGWISPEIIPSLTSNKQYPITAVYLSPVSPDLIEYQDAKTIYAVNFFNSVASGEAARKIAASATAEKAPLVDDARDAPPISYGDYIHNLKQMGIDVDAYKDRGLLINADANISPAPGNSDVMTGTVAMGMLFIESDGSIEGNLYDWTAAARDDMLNQAGIALSWWANQAPAYGASVTFSICYFDPLTNPAMSQGYEPLNGTHTSGQVGLWIDAVMTNMGYLSGSHFDKVYAFNTWLKGYAGTDWAYTAVVCYNPAAAPTTYNDGYFAWAYYGGPYTHLLYRNNGYEISDFAEILAHETGHIFYACDEYYQPGYGGCTSCDPCNTGSHGVPNGNCEYCNQDAVLCMMRTGPWVLCCYTPGQIGWSWTPDDCQSGGNLPLAPSNLIVRAPQRPKTIGLRWGDNSDNEDGFFVERKRGRCRSNRAWQEIADVPADSTRYQNRRLRPNATFSYRVRAYNGNGNSDYSNCRSATTQP